MVPQSANTSPAKDPAAPCTPPQQARPHQHQSRFSIPAVPLTSRAVKRGRSGSSGQSVKRVHDGFIAQSNAKATLNYHNFIAQMFLIFKNINIIAKLEFSKMLKLFRYITSDLSFPDKANIPLSSPQSIYYGNNLSLGRTHTLLRDQSSENRRPQNMSP